MGTKFNDKLYVSNCKTANEFPIIIKTKLIHYYKSLNHSFN